MLRRESIIEELEAVDRDFARRDALLRLAFEAMLNGKIVNFQKGLLKDYQDGFEEKLGKDFTIDAIESTGDLKLFNLKTTEVIYEVPVKAIVITNKNAWN